MINDCNGFNIQVHARVCADNCLFTPYLGPTIDTSTGAAPPASLLIIPGCHVLFTRLPADSVRPAATAAVATTLQGAGDYLPGQLH